MFRKLIILAILGIGVPHAQAGDEIIVDNRDANTTSSGTWRISAAKDFYGVDSVYSYPNAVFTWIPTMPTTGDYDVFVRWTYYSTRGTNVAYTLFHAAADSPFITTVNQKDRATAGDWFPIGRFTFDAGPNRISVSGENGQASADAVRFVYAGAPPNIALGKTVASNGLFFVDGFGAQQTVDLGSVTDGVFFTPGQNWTAGAVWWKENVDTIRNTLTIYLGGMFEIRGLIVQADNNDDYRVSWNDAIAGPSSVIVSPTFIPFPGGLAVPVELDVSAVTDSFTIEHVAGGRGDGFYSVSEFQAVGRKYKNH